jgi:hypothetical protein
MFEENPVGRIIALIAACLAFSSCGIDPTVAPAIEKSMASFVGQPIDVAIAKLGIPNDQQNIAGRTVYIWLAREVVEGTELKCQIRVIVNAGIIESFDLSGNHPGHCQRYRRMLQS